MHFWPIDLLHFGRANSEEVVSRVPYSCGYLVYMRKVCSYNGGLTHFRLLYTVTVCSYSTYLGKGSHLSFLNRSEDGIDKSASNIKRAACFCNLVTLFC